MNDQKDNHYSSKVIKETIERVLSENYCFMDQKEFEKQFFDCAKDIKNKNVLDENLYRCGGCGDYFYFCEISKFGIIRCPDCNSIWIKNLAAAFNKNTLQETKT